MIVVVVEEEAETGGVQAEAADASASVVGEKGWWILDVHYSEVQEELFVMDSGAVAQQEARGEKERFYGRGWEWLWVVGENWQQRRPC